MKKLFCLLLVLTAAACSKDKTAPAAGGSDTTGSAMAGSATGSAMAGSAATGSGSAMAGSDSGSAMAGSAMAGSGGSAAAGSGAGSGSAAAWDFDKLTHEEQADYMKKTVVPTMKPIFQKFDAKHYANFDCKTCHGKDAKKNKFKMPTPELPKLDFEALKAGKQKPNIAKWMGEEVEPNMAKLLHRPVYDPKAPDPSQFGCLGCHEQKK